MLQIRVEFDLVYRRWGLASLEDPLEVLLEIVAHANRLDETLSFQLLHLSPSLLVLLLTFAEERRVNQVQVDVVHLQLLQACLERTRDVGNAADNLRCDKKLISGDSRLLDCRSEFSLSLVHLSAVQVVVAKLDCRFSAVDAVLVYLRLIATLVPCRSCTIGQLEAVSFLLPIN